MNMIPHHQKVVLVLDNAGWHVAKALDVGSELELVPDLADPKDLFARLAQAPVAQQKKRA